MHRAINLTLVLFVTALLTTGLTQRASAQPDDPPTRVARLGYIGGSVSLEPAGESEWVQAVPNRPMTTGDKIWADRDSHAELQLGSALIELNSNTGVSDCAGNPSVAHFSKFVVAVVRSTCFQRRRRGSGAKSSIFILLLHVRLLMEESSEARKSTALAIFSGSPQRPSGIAEETNCANSSEEIDARGPRRQIGVFVAPGETTFTRMLRGARSAAIGGGSLEP